MASLVPAFIGVGGVIVGSLLALLKDYFVSRMQSEELRRYAGIRLICVLDDFGDECCSVVQDEGQYIQTQGHEDELEPVVTAPQKLVLPSDIDWKTLPVEIVYRTLKLPSRLHQAAAAISDVANISAFPPDYEDYFQERQKQFARLGIEVLNLAVDYRALLGLRPVNYPYQDPRSVMMEALAKLEDQD